MKERDMKDKDLLWEEVSTEHIVQDEWIDFRKSAFRFPDGNIFEPLIVQVCSKLKIDRTSKKYYGFQKDYIMM